MRLILAAALLLLAGCVEARPNPSEFATRLVLASPDKIGVCSGTKVSADEVETALHCVNAGLAVVMVGAVEAGAYEVIPQEGDRALVKFGRPMFDRWAKRAKAVQGERVRFWGNPKFLTNVYRVGVVAAVLENAIVVDATVCTGDSGAGLFNDSGELVGVVVRMAPDVAPCSFAVAED